MPPVGQFMFQTKLLFLLLIDMNMVQQFIMNVKNVIILIILFQKISLAFTTQIMLTLLISNVLNIAIGKSKED